MAGARHLLTAGFVWVILSAVCLLLEAKDKGCGPEPTRINVTSAGGTLYSPGYPEKYPNALSCQWLLTSNERGKVLQLRPLDLKVGLDTAARSGSCTGDVLTAYDGPSPHSPLLHVWCGEDVKVVHSTGASVLIVMVTDRLRRYKGFAMGYSLLTLPDNACETGTVRTLPLQPGSPVVVDFTAPSPSPSSSPFPYPSPTRLATHTTCSWRLVADDVRSRVVVDLERFDDGLPCGHGNFSVYDGPETSSPEIVHWCARSTKPFTSVYLSGGQGMVVVRTKPDVNPFLRFRFYTRPKTFSGCSLSHVPTLELSGRDPVYISFPFAVNESGASCPVQILSAATLTLWARLDVLRTTTRDARTTWDCPFSQSASPPVTVLQANGTGADNAVPMVVQPTCLRGGHPVFWPVAERIIVSPSTDALGLLLKITPADPGSCHGRVLHLTAPTDEAVVVKDPPASVRNLQYSRSAWCRYVVSGENEADHVLINIEAELCELRDTCGDFVRIYDGPSNESSLLYDSANRTHVTVHVISTGRHVTFEYGTDDRVNRGFIEAEFNSVPGQELCNGVQQIKADKTSQNLSSLNYPYYYPINHMCQYCITSDNPDDVIYIDVIDSDMTYTCSDAVEVYDGAETDDAAPEYLGRFCAQDRPRYVSKGPGMCLLFRSDPSRHGRGWLLSFRAAPPASSGVHRNEGQTNTSSGSSSTTTATAVVALVVLIAVIVVFIVYIVKNKRRQRRSSEE
ncbi:cubilin-like isoform X2 [Babylonia areolata]|uniref:cubilin-like isoform X2 n=1 Tax=Babylonia areolata TaxID=304850 RepID=UPI003FCFF675